MQNDVEPRTSTVRKLELERSTRVFNGVEPTWHEYDDMAAFFNGFKSLASLTLILSDYDPLPPDADSPSRWYDWEPDDILADIYYECWDTLLNRLAGVHDTLEEVEIVLKTENSYVSHFWVYRFQAMTTWRHFKRMRKIVGPFTLYCGDHRVNGMTLTPIQQYFPDSIERITVTFVDVYSEIDGYLLEPLLETIHSFSHLRKIYVFLNSYAGELLENKDDSRKEMEEIVEKFRALGIELKIWDADTEDALPWKHE
jgi:hypothetical protein